MNIDELNRTLLGRTPLPEISQTIINIVGEFNSRPCRELFSCASLREQDIELDKFVASYDAALHWKATSAIFAYLWPEYKQDRSHIEEAIRSAVSKYCDTIDSMVKCARLKDNDAMMAAEL